MHFDCKENKELKRIFSVASLYLIIYFYFAFGSSELREFPFHFGVQSMNTCTYHR